jgi:carbohydrate-binding DOMON domain-containing protein
MLPPGGGYERLILVGGGVRIEDASRTVLAEYIPVSGDESNPLGDARSATVAFAVPRSYLGAPSDRWTFTVLAGAQDDHGGAGLGEFRTVNAEPGEWNGGGKTHPADPNVYDTLVARPGH